MPASWPSDDALLTERNSARAEAAMWQRRLLNMQRERDQARADLAACEKSHREWEQAYAALRQELRRVESLQFSDALMLEHYKLALKLLAQGKLAQIPEGIYA